MPLCPKMPDEVKAQLRRCDATGDAECALAARWIRDEYGAHCARLRGIRGD